MFYGLIILTGLTQKSNAQNYLVSGSWNTSQNGTYVYSGTCNGFPYYVLGTNALVNNGYYWGIGDYSYSGSPCAGWMPFDYYNFSSSSTPPTSGWGNGLTVEIAAPKLILAQHNLLKIVQIMEQFLPLLLSLIITLVAQHLQEIMEIIL